MVEISLLLGGFVALPERVKYTLALGPAKNRKGETVEVVSLTFAGADYATRFTDVDHLRTVIETKRAVAETEPARRAAVAVERKAKRDAAKAARLARREAP